MSSLLRRPSQILTYFLIAFGLAACGGDPMVSGLDPFAPMVFKEGVTKLPQTPPDPSTLVPFYVSQQTIFKFAVDTSSI
jgi:hypothetical protein